MPITVRGGLPVSLARAAFEYWSEEKAARESTTQQQQQEEEDQRKRRPQQQGVPYLVVGLDLAANTTLVEHAWGHRCCC